MRCCAAFGGGGGRTKARAVVVVPLGLVVLYDGACKTLWLERVCVCVVRDAMLNSRLVFVCLSVQCTKVE